jgi:hypothetical protein
MGDIKLDTEAVVGAMGEAEAEAEAPLTYGGSGRGSGRRGGRGDREGAPCAATVSTLEP